MNPLPAFIVSRARDLLGRLRRDRQGVAAVEFAIIVTLMVPLLLGTFETTQALQASRKVSVAARALADLASQSASLSDNDMSNILNATRAIVAPFPQNRTIAVVTGIKIDDKGNASVAWSDICNKAGSMTDSGGNSVGQRRSVGSSITVPDGVKPPVGTAGFLVLAEVYHRYVPAIGWQLEAGITLSDRLYSSPRIGASVNRTGTSASCT
ncbi:TadE/TadG family type IV pilus assembly protein [Phreatobacter sp. AB_2022a]|uniref:TadE/TadG family type IV pilus assembly protein n=1 Tax=Phreatobacter sp. AB_2022a TaxID=3003134 RepID=UPI0022875D9A|nr:TadE/TadG family type IV pilus assembly protein [Phreatobacter sp. AB_2022a]MCZ0736032.1 pilus assembly protein [Phreatobacter sp. AB_2022a]